MDLLRGLQKQFADLERRSVPRGIRAATKYRNAGSPVVSARPLMNPVVAAGLGSVGMTANLLSRGAVIPSLIEKTKEVFNPKDNIITSLRNFGTSVGNQFVPPGQRRPYVGSSPTAVAANQRRYRGVIGSIPPSADGESYRHAELRLADAARPGGGGGGGGNAGYSLDTFTGQPGMGSPAERAYRQKLSRTAQLTAQDPELQRYERARSTAKTQEEMNAVRDEGMRIWAAKHGGLAAKVKPGSTGYEAIQGVINPATASFLNNEQVLGTQSFDPNTALSTAQQIQGQFRPNQALTDQEILAAQSYDPNIAMSSAGNIAFAPSSPAEAGMLKAVGGAQGEYITPMSTTTFANPLEQRKAIFQELLNRAGTRGR